MALPKNLIYLVLFVVLFVIGYFIATGNNNLPEPIKRSQVIMGTVIEIQVRDGNEEKANEAIAAAFNEVKRIETIFTTYDSSSPVWKINNSSDSVITVTEEIFNVIKRCDSLWHVTKGAFDASLNSLIDAWGFEKENPSVPSKEKISDALEKSGWHNIELLTEQRGLDPVKINRIRRKNNVGINFGAVAKGYAVDRAIELLNNFGIKDALVNAGGEIKQIGENWIIGVQHPRLPGVIIEKIKLYDKAVASSGDYEQYFEVDGKRYHHIINPADGYPAQGCRSVTILADDDISADAIATGVFVLGPDRGLRLIEELTGVEGMLIDSSGNKKYSSGFKKFLSGN